MKTIMCVALLSLLHLKSNATIDKYPTGKNKNTGKSGNYIPSKKLSGFNVSTFLKNFIEAGQSGKAVLEYTKEARPIEAYFFPGQSTHNALIIGGVHGSELSSVEVVRNVIANLSSGTKPYYNVLVLPNLFPDNSALAERHPEEIGSFKNIGRYSNAEAADPNRQMPPLGKPFIDTFSFDFAGRPIEMENALLLQIIQAFQPERIASVHAIRNTKLAGVYADPRTDCNGYAKGYETDSALAIKMAFDIKENGGCVPGNRLDSCPSALYYTDPVVAKPGTVQKRNLHGCLSVEKKGYGVSLGSWATTSVCNPQGIASRDAAMLFTIEFPGNKRSIDYTSEKDRAACLKNIQAYGSAITNLFLKSNNKSSDENEIYLTTSDVSCEFL
jgi:hypothetical protein